MSPNLYLEVELWSYKENLYGFLFDMNDYHTYGFNVVLFLIQSSYITIANTLHSVGSKSSYEGFKPGPALVARTSIISSGSRGRLGHTQHRLGKVAPIILRDSEEN